MTDQPVTVEVIDPADGSDEATPVLTPDEGEAPFTGSVLIQLFDEHGNLKDERRGGGS
jgi:hypothetical protein